MFTYFPLNTPKGVRIALYGLNFAHLTSVPSPESRMMFLQLILRYTPAEDRSCLATTNCPPAAPRNLMKSLSIVFTVIVHQGSRKLVMKGLVSRSRASLRTSYQSEKGNGEDPPLYLVDFSLSSTICGKMQNNRQLQKMANKVALPMRSSCADERRAIRRGPELSYRILWLDRYMFMCYLTYGCPIVASDQAGTSAEHSERTR